MEKPNRPQRNRRHSRRAWPPEDDLQYTRPAKRLFTPEIKRMLKEWLVRRRENPYPSREEKKHLAIETGLTYTQICNWFANWRRKLKNSEREKSKRSWGHLIKHYNNNAKGNVEQFSISSEDSIWAEEEKQRQNINEHSLKGDKYVDSDEQDSILCDIEGSIVSNDIEKKEDAQAMNLDNLPDYYLDAITTRKGPRESFVLMCHITNSNSSNECVTKTKYKQKIMEKYLRDTNNAMLTSNNLNLPPTEQHYHQVPTNNPIIKSESELSKWLESAARFTPNKNNYYIEWNNKRNKLEKNPITTKTFTSPTNSVSLQTSSTTVEMFPLLYSTTSLVQKDKSQDHQSQHIYDVIHHKDELDAAEALANLAFNCRQKMLDSAANSRKPLSLPLNIISS